MGYSEAAKQFEINDHKRITAQEQIYPKEDSEIFAALGGWLILHQTLAPRELLGCALMFAAIILAQLPGKAKQTA